MLAIFIVVTLWIESFQKQLFFRLIPVSIDDGMLKESRVSWSIRTGRMRIEYSQLEYPENNKAGVEALERNGVKIGSWNTSFGSESLKSGIDLGADVGIGRFLGLRWWSQKPSDHFHWIRLRIHCATVAILLILPILPWLYLQWRTFRRRRSGLCVACGYDLRATASNCPECGASIAPRDFDNETLTIEA
jgi:hypothetical protein